MILASSARLRLPFESFVLYPPTQGRARAPSTAHSKCWAASRLRWGRPPARQKLRKSPISLGWSATCGH